MELRQIDAAVFFGGDPGSPDTLQKFYADVEMYANNFEGADAEKYLGDWVCDEFPSPENAMAGWQHTRGTARRSFEATLAKLSQTADPAERAARSTIELNDMIVNSAAIIPLIHRGRVSTKSNTLGGVLLNPWDSELWNVADWHRMQ